MIGFQDVSIVAERSQVILVIVRSLVNAASNFEASLIARIAQHYCIRSEF